MPSQAELYSKLKSSWPVMLGDDQDAQQAWLEMAKGAVGPTSDTVECVGRLNVDEFVRRTTCRFPDDSALLATETWYPIGNDHGAVVYQYQLTWSVQTHSSSGHSQ